MLPLPGPTENTKSNPALTSFVGHVSQPESTERVIQTEPANRDLLEATAELADPFAFFVPNPPSDGPASQSKLEEQAVSDAIRSENELRKIRRELNETLKRDMLLEVGDKSTKSRQFRKKVNRIAFERLAEQRRLLEEHQEKRDADLRKLDAVKKQFEVDDVQR